jgi:hypothetical protein
VERHAAAPAGIDRPQERETPEGTPEPPSDPPAPVQAPESAVDASTDWFAGGSWAPSGKTNVTGGRRDRASGLSTRFENSGPNEGCHPQTVHERDTALEPTWPAPEASRPGRRLVSGARRPELRHRSHPTGCRIPPAGCLRLRPRVVFEAKRNAQRNRRFLTDPSSPMQAREPTCRCKHRRDQQVFEAPLGKT